MNLFFKLAIWGFGHSTCIWQCFRGWCSTFTISILKGLEIQGPGNVGSGGLGSARGGAGLSKSSSHFDLTPKPKLVLQ